VDSLQRPRCGTAPVAEQIAAGKALIVYIPQRDYDSLPPDLRGFEHRDCTSIEARRAEG
jgi:hypothetical protein